jgi:hypothetical protein
MSSRPFRGAAARLVPPMAIAAVLSGVLSCELVQGDPVHEAQVSALGPERAGIDQGEFHRAGQPCVVCHSTQGPAKTVFSFAGTVFEAASGTQPGAMGDPGSTGVDQAVIGVLDSTHREIRVVSNCVGNFFISPDQIDPTFPVLVAVSKGKSATYMMSHISREGSCAECHMRKAGPDSPGQIFFSASGVPDCKVSPITPVE